MQQTYELIDTNRDSGEEKMYLSQTEVIDYLRQHVETV